MITFIVMQEYCHFHMLLLTIYIFSAVHNLNIVSLFSMYFMAFVFNVNLWFVVYPFYELGTQLHLQGFQTWF